MAWQYHFELLTRPYGGVSEGPVWDGEAILFTHIPSSRIMRYDPDSGAITESRSGTNHTNGLAFDARATSSAAVRAAGPSSALTTMPLCRWADRVDGQKLNTPNDLAIDRSGRIWVHQPLERR